MTDRFLSALRQHGLKDVSIAAEGARILGYLDTGNFALNWIVSNKFTGGWPLGHVTEIFGDPSTGKSYLIARAIASALSGGGVALLDDTEGAFNAVWSNQKLGVDTSRLAYRRSGTVAEHMESIVSYIEAYKSVIAPPHSMTLGPSILALDSLALLTTEHEQEVGLSKVSLTRAKEIRTMFRVTGSKLSAIPVAYIIANHTIANIGDFFNDTTTPGGGGPKFQASVRIKLQLSSKIKTVDKQIVGVRVRATVDKNRLAVPWRTSDLVIPFYEPISVYSGLVPLLLNLKVLEAPGRNLVFKGEDTKIKENKSDFLKQDHSAEELMARYPDLLKDLDLNPGNLGVVQSMDGAVEENASKSSSEG